MEPSQQTPPALTQAEEANQIIRSHVLWAMGAGAVPIPVIDLIAVSGVQMDMLRQLFKTYNRDFNESYFKAWITSLGATFVTRLASSSIKLIPGFGTLLGGISQVVLSGATTYAIGQVVTRHLENGGTAINFNADNFKDFFNEQFEKGKEFARNLSKDQPAAAEVKPETVNPKDELISRLEKLAELKAQGILSEEEFRQMKEKLIAEL